MCKAVRDQIARCAQMICDTTREAMMKRASSCYSGIRQASSLSVLSLSLPITPIP